MEPDVSMETASTIRVAVVPVGGAFSADQFRDYASILLKNRRVDLSSVATFYMENQKSPFSHQPWETGSLRFQFILGGSPASPWDDFQPNRKILAVVGICHCPNSPDLSVVSENFGAVCKNYGSALVQRCFCFFPSDAQLGDKSNKDSRIILFPPSDRKTQEFHMLTMVQDLAASLLMEFEKWVLNGESSGTILKTPLDSQASLSSEEFIKAKKKRLGRAQKTIGDYCLLAGSAVDANDHYTTAIELARLTGDVFWHAGALEGSVSALLVDRMDAREPALEEEVKYRYYTVIQLYRRSFVPDNSHRVSTVSFELEAALKLARFLCRQENAKEVVDMLMGAADGAKSLIDASDRLILYIEIARIFGTLGYQRKAAFFSRQVAQLYLQQDSAYAALSAMKVLSLSSKAYRIQSKKAESGNSTALRTESKSHQAASIVALYESQWSNLQMILLREVLMSSVRAGDPLAAWSAAARLLRSHYPLITPAGQAALASSLAASASRLPHATRSPDPALPFVRLHSFLPGASSADIVEKSSGKNWWRGSAPSGPFIYTPFSRGNGTAGGTARQTMALTWVVGEPVQVLVELANPCAFDLSIESIRLLASSDNVDAFPVSVRLTPNSAKVVPLTITPTRPGPVSIPGCVVHCFGVVTEHLFCDVDSLLLGAAQGLVLSDPFRACGAARARLTAPPPITVVPPLPLLSADFPGSGGAAVLYEGELRDLSLRLTNAGTVPVTEAHLSLSGKNQDSIVFLSREALEAALPLAPGSEVSVPLTIKAWQLSASKEASAVSCPVLIIHYAGPSDDGVPGRRLAVPLHLSVCRGLRFVKARLLAMEIPARVGEEEEGRGLVKINPNRGSWGLRLLELELANPTDEAFEVSVLVQPETSAPASTTRIDRDYSARVLIPLEHFKLPVIDGSFFSGERSAKAEVDVCVDRLLSRIRVTWRSGRSGHGELSFKEAAQAAVQTSVMDVLLPDPLTFVFRHRREGPGGAFFSGDLAALEILVRNNTEEMIKVDLTVTCRDVAGNDCIGGDDPTVLWAGVLNSIGMEVPARGEMVHPFSLYFMVPGEYTLLGSAVIEEPTDMIRNRARVDSADEPIFCRGSPFHLHVRAAM